MYSYGNSRRQRVNVKTVTSWDRDRTSRVFIVILSRVSTAKRRNSCDPVRLSVCLSRCSIISTQTYDRAIFTKRSPKTLLFGDAKKLRKFIGYRPARQFYTDIGYPSFSLIWPASERKQRRRCHTRASGDVAGIGGLIVVVLSVTSVTWNSMDRWLWRQCLHYYCTPWLFSF